MITDQAQDAFMSIEANNYQVQVESKQDSQNGLAHTASATKQIILLQ